MKGYVLESNDGSFLTKDFVWYPYKDIKDAFVHPKENLRTILEEWENKVAKIHLAEYDLKGV